MMGYVIVGVGGLVLGLIIGPAIRYLLDVGSYAKDLGIDINSTERRQTMIRERW